MTKTRSRAKLEEDVQSNLARVGELEKHIRKVMEERDDVQKQFKIFKAHHTATKFMHQKVELQR
jgi:hypothetical protein